MPSLPLPDDDATRPATQLTLLDLPDAKQLTTDIRGTGHYTGERLKRDRPEIYDAVVKCLAEGMGILRIAAAFKVSNHTVTAVRDAEGLSIAAEKKKISSNLRDFAKIGSERLVDEVANIPVAQLPIAIAVAIDKMQVLDGEPNRILETRQKVPSIEDLNTFFESLPNVTPTPAGMGFGGDRASLKGVADEGAEEVGTDNESVDIGLQVVDGQEVEDE